MYSYWSVKWLPHHRKQRVILILCPRQPSMVVSAALDFYVPVGGGSIPRHVPKPLIAALISQVNHGIVMIRDQVHHGIVMIRQQVHHGIVRFLIRGRCVVSYLGVVVDLCNVTEVLLKCEDILNRGALNLTLRWECIHVVNI